MNRKASDDDLLNRPSRACESAWIARKIKAFRSSIFERDGSVANQHRLRARIRTHVWRHLLLLASIPLIVCVASGCLSVIKMN